VSPENAVLKVPGSAWSSPELAACVFNSFLVNTAGCDDRFDDVVVEMDEGATHSDADLHNPDNWINIAF
jgi:hypothetical protein